MTKICVLGGGAWGTALASLAVTAGNDVRLWSRRPEVADSINAGNGNTRYLPDVDLPSGLSAMTDMEQALAGAEAVLLVTPAQAVGMIVRDVDPILPEGIPIVICSKGVEQDTLRPMTSVVTNALPDNPVAILSGPTFAREAALGMPTAVVIACADMNIADHLCGLLATPTFRPYASDDTAAVCLAGAVKNVLAIACGIVAGRKLGDNAAAALITRGLAEMRRLVVALGGRPETVDGLSGLGDLALTAGSLQSRNMSLGFALGQGQSLEAVLESRHSVTEGVWTAAALVKLAARNDVEMPICAAVDGILNNGDAIDEAIATLLTRPLTRE